MLEITHKTKKIFLATMKLIIVVASFYFIYYKLKHNQTITVSVFKKSYTKSNLFLSSSLFSLFSLTVLNWFLEIKKWQQLTLSFNAIPFKKAIEQTLGAYTVSLFTPNRIGEYGAKTLYFTKDKKKEAIVANLIGNSSQMITTFGFGLLGLFFYTKKHLPPINFLNLNRTHLILLTVICFLLIIFYKQTFIEELFKLVKNTPKSTYHTTLLLSASRYLVFSFQFYFLLILFHVKIEYSVAMMAISVMYLFSSVIPSLAILDIAIKGSVSVYVFSQLGVPEIPILNTVTSIWILNSALPAIIGSYYVFKFKLPLKDNLCYS